MNTSATVVLIGRLSRDAELKYLPSGLGVLNFSVVTSKSRKDGDAWKEIPSFWDCAMFGADAEKKAERMKKGTGVRVIGEQEIQEYQKDGQTVRKVKITAQIVDLWYYGTGGQSGGDNAPQTPPRATTANSRQPAQSADGFEDDMPVPF
jgi:single-strand DNA-binding protein